MEKWSSKPISTTNVVRSLLKKHFDAGSLMDLKNQLTSQILT